MASLSRLRVRSSGGLVQHCRGDPGLEPASSRSLLAAFIAFLWAPVRFFCLLLLRLCCGFASCDAATCSGTELVTALLLAFVGFGGCIAAARSGAELAAALLHAVSASCWSHHRTRFFGFNGCGAAACSDAELAAALLPVL